MKRLLDLQQRLQPVLAPLGAVYGHMTRVRRELYARGAYPRWQPPAPAVSVGNLRSGGTGKTPVVRWLMEHAVAAGQTPCVLTRGYGARPPKRPFLVTPDAAPRHAGDEPLLLAMSCPEGHVLVDPVRTRSGAYAHATLAPHLYILDDGFQHIAVQRHVDLVLFTPEDIEKDWNRVLPAGQWRESALALAHDAPCAARARALLIKCPRDDDFGPLREALVARLTPLCGADQLPIFGFSLAFAGLRQVRDGKRVQRTPGQRYTLATGVADPASVLTSVRHALGTDPVHISTYVDHHAFSDEDARKLAAMAAENNADQVVVTAKDAVKLRRHTSAAGFLYLDVEPRFMPAQHNEHTDFPRWWEAALADTRACMATATTP